MGYGSFDATFKRGKSVDGASVIAFQFSKKTAVVCAVAVLFCLGAIFHNELNSLFRYSRDEIFQGQIWRVLSAHFVHTNWVHGVMNAAAWLLIMGIVGTQYSWLRWTIGIVVMGCGISLLLLWLNPELHGYVGFSGVLHGLLSLGLLQGVVHNKDKIHAVALVFLVLKVGREQLPEFNVQHLDHLIDAPVVVDAHMYGALMGVIVFLIFYAFDYLKSRDRNSNASSVSE